MLKKISFVAVVVSLFGSVTNLIYLSATASLFAVLLLPLILIQKRLVLPKFLFFLWIFTLYSLCSAILYDWKSLFRFMFYRYDGNFFISYLPLLIFSFLSVNFNLEKTLKIFLFASCVVNGIIYLYLFAITNGDILFSLRVGGGAGTIFNPLFRANNAGGGFYSILFSLSLALYLSTKKRIFFFTGIFFLLFLWGTASRGSLLGAIVGIVCCFLYIKGWRYLLYMIFGVVIFTQMIILYHSYPYYVEYASRDTLPQLKNDFGIETNKSQNVYIRACYYWPRALFLFSESPFLGTGFGSFNDDPVKIALTKNTRGFINETKDKRLDDSHAHHSFLHFLAEEGIVGLSIFLLFWIHLFRYIVSKQRKYSESVRIFLIMAFFNLTFMSFTEHRLTTPSNAFPFILPLVLALMYDNAHKQKSRSVCELP
jgi:O-antigen ligase